MRQIEVMNFMQIRKAALSFYKYSGIFILGALLIYLSIETNPFYELLYFENTNILEGEVWRIFTAHITHNNLEHLLVNLTAFVIAFVLFENKLTVYNWLWFLLFSTTFIGGCYLLFEKNDSSFVGSSGLAYATFILMSLSNYNTNKLLSIILVSFILIVVLCQQFFDNISIFSMLDETSIAARTHLYGIISGFIYFLFLKYRKMSEEYLKG